MRCCSSRSACCWFLIATAKWESAGSSSVRVCDYLALILCVHSAVAHLLFVSFLGEQGKCHFGSRGLGSTVTLVGHRSGVPRPRSNRQRDIEYGTSVKFPGLQTLSHHLGVLTLKVSIILRVYFFLLPGDDDGFVRRFL